jgi:hypothetical protein
MVYPPNSSIPYAQDVVKYARTSTDKDLQRRKRLAILISVPLGIIFFCVYVFLITDFRYIR